MKSQLSISVSEFLELERMSNGGIALLQHEHAHHELEHEGGAIARPKELAEETAARDPPRAHGNDDGHGDGQGTKQQRLSMENSTRVALLLARSFVQFCELSEASHVNISHVLSAMKLDNFMISLDQQKQPQPQPQQQLSPDTDNYYENKEEEDFCSSKAKSAAPTQSRNRSQSQCSKPPMGSVSSSEPNHDDDVNNQETQEQQEQQLQPGFFSQFDGNDGAYRDIYYFSKPQKQMKKNNNLSSSSSSSSSIKDVNGTQMGMGYFSCLSNHENNVSKLNDDAHVDDDVDTSCNNEGGERKVEEHDDATNTVSVTQGSCSSSSSRRTDRISSSVPAPQPPPKPIQWNLKKIEISFPNGVPNLPSEQQHHSLHSHQHHQSHYSRAQAMQNLGRLLYSIFSYHHHHDLHHHGESPSSDLFPNSRDEIKINNNDNNNNNGKDGEQRPSKRTRDTNGSVFLKLLDTKASPISICRYLSDLMSMSSSCSVGVVWKKTTMAGRKKEYDTCSI